MDDVFDGPKANHHLLMKTVTFGRRTRSHSLAHQNIYLQELSLLDRHSEKNGIFLEETHVSPLLSLAPCVFDCFSFLSMHSLREVV